MRDLLNHYENKIYFNCEDKFSPVTTISVGLALDYCVKIVSDKIDMKPLVISYPLKHLGSLWLSTGLLMKYFSDDYCFSSEEHYKNLNLKAGDKIEIFSAIAKIIGFKEGYPILKFKDVNGVYLNKKYLNNINKCPANKKSLNLHNLYAKNRKRLVGNLNAISRLLGANNVVNSNILNSKIFLISGRGQTKPILEGLHNNVIYDEPLSKILKIDENLIIKSSLDCLKPYFEKKDESKFDDYMIYFKAILDSIEKTDDSNLDILIKCVNEDRIYSKIFKNALDNIDDTIFGDGELNWLQEEFPGIKENLDFTPQAVIINGIEQLENFKGTVEGLLNNKVPVIIITDKNTVNKGYLGTEQILNVNFPDSYQLNWNKRKIESIKDNGKYIDNKLWASCLNYCSQTINFKNCINEKENDFYDFRKLILSDELENHVSLRNSYWKYMEPAFAMYKNNSGSASENFAKLFNKFFEAYKPLKDYIPPNVLEKIEQYIYNIKGASEVKNIKEIGDHIFFFRQKVIIDNDKFHIPDTRQRDSNSSYTISFSGYPLNEQRDGYFRKSVFEDLIPEIIFHGWEVESSRTYNYLVKEIKSTWISDSIESLLPNRLSLNDDNKLDHELNERFKLENLPQIAIPEIEIETIGAEERKLGDLRFSSLKNSEGIGNQYLVKVNIINFSDQTYYLVPHATRRSTKFLIRRDENKVVSVGFDDLETEDFFFDYKIDKGFILDINRHNQTYAQTFQYLDFWRDCLHKIFFRNGNNIEKTKADLLQVKQRLNLNKANPSESNIKRWLFDTNMYAPIGDNLKMILSALLKTKIDFELKQVVNSQREAMKLTRDLKGKFKTKVERKIAKKDTLEESSFVIQTDGMAIPVQTKIIASLETRNDLEIEYSNTHKIINEW